MKYDYEKGIFGNILELFSGLTSAKNDLYDEYIERSSEDRKTDTLIGSDSLAASEQFRAAMQQFVQTLSDKDSLQYPYVLPRWKTDNEYRTVGERFTYGLNNAGDPQIYKVILTHRSQQEWTPDITPSLYTKVGTTPEGYDEWSQPSGAADAYNTGDIVSHSGTLYISDVDANVWEPGVYGWSLYTP